MSNQPLLAYNVWLALPPETRVKLTKLFGIPRTGEVIVQTGDIVDGNIGSVVKQDGHAPGDLYAITVEKMQQILGTDDTDFYKMFNHIVENIDYILNPKEEEVILIEEEIVSVEEKTNFAELMADKPVEQPKKKRPYAKKKKQV